MFGVYATAPRLHSDRAGSGVARRRHPPWRRARTRRKPKGTDRQRKREKEKEKEKERERERDEKDERSGSEKEREKDGRHEENRGEVAFIKLALSQHRTIIAE